MNEELEYINTATTRVANDSKLSDVVTMLFLQKAGNPFSLSLVIPVGAPFEFVLKQMEKICKEARVEAAK